jgi:aspartate aminotransferase-like enzyme
MEAFCSKLRATMERKLLMVAGPTEIESDVLQAAAQPMVYNRTADFSAFMLGIEDNLKRVFKTKNDVLIMCSSGTGAMEAAVVNLLSEGDEVLVVSGGVFGYRWYEIASQYNVNCKLLELPQGETATGDMIKEHLTPGIRAVFITANETSTGVLTDLAAIGDVVKATNAVLVVDAVSSLGADMLETDAWHCDVVITSSQKALALPPGLSFITLSKKAWGLVHESTIPKYYFNLKEYKNNLVRGQTPFTPAISLLYQLDLRLRKLCEAGFDGVLQSQKFS